MRLEKILVQAPLTNGLGGGYDEVTYLVSNGEWIKLDGYTKADIKILEAALPKDEVK